MERKKAAAARASINGPRSESTVKRPPRRTTAKDLLPHAKGWAGDDLEEVMRVVKQTRSKARF